MPKRAMSFKPTPECEVQLAELMGRFKFDRTAVVIMAIDVAHRTLMVGEPKVLPKDPKEVERVVGSAKVAKQRLADDLRGDGGSGLKAGPGPVKTGNLVSPEPRTMVLTREEREAKIAEAQKWLGKK